MKQRSVSAKLVDLVLREGELNRRGDKVTLDRKQVAILEKDYKNRGIWNKETLHAFERLVRRGGMTVVVVGGTAITTYFGIGKA